MNESYEILSSVIIDKPHPILVSFTSWKPRLKFLPEFFKNLKKLTLKPDRYILWLSSDEISKDEVPLELYSEPELSICWVKENLLSFKKFLTILLFPQAYNIVIDDDLLYYPDMIKDLINKSKKLHDEQVVCYQFDSCNSYGLPWGTVEKDITKYKWLNDGMVLFPPNTFPSLCFDYFTIAFKDESLISDECFLMPFIIHHNIKACTLGIETPIFKKCPKITGSQDSALHCNFLTNSFRTNKKNSLIWRIVNRLPKEYFISYKTAFPKFGDDIIDINEELIIALTSWPKRILNVPIVLDTIYNQTILPNKVVLNLSEEEFPNKEKDIKLNVLDYLILHKVEINWVSGKNTKLWKKIIPTLFLYPKAFVINIDDDIKYPIDFVESLWKLHLKFPNNPITVNRTFRMHGRILHAGYGTLSCLSFYNNFSGIDLDGLYSLLSSDTVYTYLLNKNDRLLIPIDKTLKFVTFNEICPLSKGNERSILKNDKEKAWKYMRANYGTLSNVIKWNPESTKPYCVFGVANTERGKEIAKEMREWLIPNYNLIEIWHDGSQYEYPAMKYMQDLCIETGKPCLYIHTRGAFNVHWTTTKTRKMWKLEYGSKSAKYFNLVKSELPTCACPFTGSKKYTWYNGFVVNAEAMKSIPEIVPSTDRMVFEHLFQGTNVKVIGTLVNTNDGKDLDSIKVVRRYLKAHY